MGDRWKNYGLWAAVLSFIPMLLASFGIDLLGDFQEIGSAFLSILVMAGIINNPTTANKGFTDDTQKKLPEEDSSEE